MIIVYCCEPIDNWVGWTDEVRFLARIVPPEDDWIRDEYVAFSSRAYELARLVW